MEEFQKIAPLEKSTDIYKIIIPLEVEKKIRYLCNKISQVEWSGTLFYTYSGSFEDNDLEIKCVDIFPMDIGSSTYTEFDMSPDVIAYMTDHPELLDCQMGLIHSHNSMATFFSGTDTNTLAEEGNDRNHFVSLIVNNKGTYTAAITRKLSIKKVIDSHYTYKSFGDIERAGKKTVEISEEVIMYNYLDIIKEGDTTESFKEIEERLEVIKKNKANIPAKPPISTYFDKFSDYKDNWNKKDKSVKQATLFDNEFMESEPPRKLTSHIKIESSVVNSITLQLITGSIAIADSSRIDPVIWTRQMSSLFDKRFGNSMALFDLWAETMVEFILVNFVPDEYSFLEDEYTLKLAQAVYVNIDKLPKNKYIESIKSALTLWMK